MLKKNGHSRKPVYAALMAMYENYDSDVTVPEDRTRAEKAEERKFIDEVRNSHSSYILYLLYILYIIYIHILTAGVLLGRGLPSVPTLWSATYWSHLCVINDEQ